MKKKGCSENTKKKKNTKEGRKEKEKKSPL